MQKFRVIFLFLIFCFQGLNAAQSKQIITLSQTPKVLLIPKFLSVRECDPIIKMAEPYLQPSTVADPYGKSAPHPARTSYGMFFPKEPHDKMILKQILRCSVNQEFKPQYDFFQQECYLKRGGQRLITVIMYLNTPEEGGETIFPKINLSIKPEKGNALVFFNLDQSGAVDLLTLHGGAPVKKGVKYIATKWIREGFFV